MEIILDSLENLIATMTTSEAFGITNRRPYSIKDVEGLFQSLDNSFVEKV